jgi:hypothetical protein
VFVSEYVITPDEQRERDALFGPDSRHFVEKTAAGWQLRMYDIRRDTFRCIQAGTLAELKAKWQSVRTAVR